MTILTLMVVRFVAAILTSAIILLVSPKKSRFKASSSLVACWRDKFFKWIFWSGSSITVTFLHDKKKTNNNPKMKTRIVVRLSLFHTFISIAPKRCHLKPQTNHNKRTKNIKSKRCTLKAVLNIFLTLCHLLFIPLL